MRSFSGGGVRAFSGSSARFSGLSGKVEAAGARAICAKDAYPLGPDIIHSVTNPLSRLTGALQVYGGDLYGVIRSEWDLETLCEQRVQVAPSVQLFEAANAAMRV